MPDPKRTPNSPRKRLAGPIPPNYSQLRGSERKPALGSRRVGDANPRDRLNVTICLRRRSDAPPLPDQEHWIRTPLGRRKFLSREDFATQYGAAQADLDKVVSFATVSGLTVVSTDIAQRIRL